jgi:hypothetical protein
VYLIIIKLAEVASRALFVVSATYFLPLQAAGQLGMVVTLASLFTFAANYERHHDIQRRAAGMAPEDVDREVRNALPFWAFNMAVVTPLYIVALMLLARMPLTLVLITLPIAIGEQVSTHAYQMATIEPRYNRLVTIVAGKNMVLALLAGALLVVGDGQLELRPLLILWAGLQLLAITAIVGGWLLIQRTPPAEPTPLAVRIFSQHRASLTHFKIGLVAIATLQFDRLGVGALLPLEDVGIYLRHVLAISFVYQLLSVTFINRFIPIINKQARLGELRESIARRPVKELALIAGAATTALGGVALMDEASGRLLSDRFALSWGLSAVLLAGALARTGADCGALFCNAWHRETTILRAQITAFVGGALLLFALTPVLGMTGPALASLTFSTTYLVLVTRAIRHMPDKAAV